MVVGASVDWKPEASEEFWREAVVGRQNSSMGRREEGRRVYWNGDRNVIKEWREGEGEEGGVNDDEVIECSLYFVVVPSLSYGLWRRSMVVAACVRAVQREEDWRGAI